MQHFQVKIFVRPAGGVNLEPAIAVFHRWIRESALPELLIDVADYRHVPAGPGVMLVGHDSHYGLDERKNRLGLLYSRRTAMDGTVGDRLNSAIGAARRACELLTADPAFAGALRFDDGEFEIAVNDRALAPNTADGYLALEAEVKPVLDAMWGAGSYDLRSVGAPRELLTVSAIRR